MLLGIDGCAQAPSTSESPAGQTQTSAPPFSRKTLTDILGPTAASLESFVDKDVNVVEFKGRALGRRLQQKWEAAGRGRFTIAHYGDSHVQLGYGAEAARNKLQVTRGSAGRGMVFPFAIAKTYSHNDFSSTFEGEWTTANSIQSEPRIPLGVSGFVAQTFDRAAAFILNFATLPEPGAKKVRLFYVVTAPGYQVSLSSGGRRWERPLPVAIPGSASQHVDFDVPRLTDELRFEIRRTGADDAYFEVHGVSIENVTPGVMYHNLGVGGANFSALLAQTYFDEQSRALSPDLIILDWGTNDIIYKNAVAADLEGVIVDTIRKVRAVHPDALIMLTSTQDMYFQNRPVTSAWDFAVLIRRIAMENDCLMYDWYRVAGGRDSIRTWYVYGLARTDHLHLTSNGYAVKGDLMAQALLNTFDILKRAPSRDSILVSTRREENPRSVSAWLKALKPFETRPDMMSGISAKPGKPPPKRNPPPKRKS